jgi:deoxyribodipyrimidine photo-lyase
MRLDPDRADPARHPAPLYVGPTRPPAGPEPSQEAAERAAASYDVAGYARSRGRVDGNVSRLNPYVTWGVLTPRELQDVVQRRHPVLDADLRKFLAELGWKAFFRAAFRALGGRVYRSLEPPKVPRDGARTGAPPGALDGTTGLGCIDRIARELIETGALHNYARLGFASWWVHGAGHAWQPGEAFFYRHLVDGEPGPNALSWQWVASTFSAKPFLTNAAALRRAGIPGCEGTPLDASREELAARIGARGPAPRPRAQPRARPGAMLPGLVREPVPGAAVLLHAERLSLRARPLAELPGAPAIVVLDGRRLRSERPAYLRLRFAAELAADLARRLREEGRPVRLLLADDEDEVAAAAAELGAAGIAAPDSWHPGTWRTLQRLDARLPVAVRPEPPFAEVEGSLRSFSAFWKRAEAQVLDRVPAGPSDERP